MYTPCRESGRRISGLLAAALAFLAGFPCAASAAAPADGLPGGANTNYVGNRAPLLASPFIKLPVGAVRPEGWVRHQLELMTEGMSGRLAEISPWCKFEGSAWTDPQGGRLGWEELPYWLKGYISLGYVINDERIIGDAKRWVEAAFASQRPDGYFGPNDGLKNHDIWPNMCMLYVLRTYYEATADPRVPQLMTRYFKWMNTVPFEHLLLESWQKIRGGDNLDSIYWLYNLTGEPWLLETARVNHERTADWTGLVASWHGVNICQSFREPAQYYQQYGDVRHLKAAYRNYDTVWGIYGQVPGGLFGADENARPGYTGPRQGAETCSIVEFMNTAQMLLRITADITWADRCEDAAFNMLPAAQTPDLKALHYLTAPNQIQLDRQNKAPMIENGGDMFSYSPSEQYRCCQHNVAFGWPYYAENLWMAAPANGLAAVFYAPSTVKAKVGDGAVVTVVEETSYPFGETVEFKLSADKPVKFPFVLRVPGWCNGAKIQVNGQAANVAAKAGTWATIDREWKSGDTVRLELPMSIRIQTWERNHKSVSVYRGPVGYSLKIGERWQKYGPDEKWPRWEVFPTTAWNYGLVLDAQDPAKSFEVVKADAKLAPQPFTHDAAPISLKAKGKRIPGWKQEDNGMVGLLQRSPVRSDEPVEEITLIPMGCARLRICAFPTIGEGANARAWAATTYKPSASHCFESDTINALADELEPDNSADSSIPRFTWYNHLGTREWVQHTFSAPRKVSQVEVYWFDDTRRAGQCAVPASWTVQWLDGQTWRPAKGAEDLKAKVDEFNRATFEPVTTTALRIEVQLAPRRSGGILEWKVAE